MKSITIGIPTVNGPNRINNCLESIKKWNDIPSIASSKGTLKHDYKVDIMILDDGSNRANVESMVWLSKFYNIPVLIHKENMGISKSWNDLANQGNSDIIVLLNDDILVSENWLTAMCYFLENNENAGGVGYNFYFITEMDIPSILEADKPLMIDRDPFTKELRHEVMTIDDAIEQELFQFAGQPGKVMCAVGSCFAIRREIFELIDGGFCEEMKSFSEESLSGDRIILIRNQETDLLELITLDELYDQYQVDDNNVAEINGIDTLSGILEKNTPLALDFCLTDKEKSSDTQNRKARKNKKIRNGCYIQKGVWDNIKYITRHKPKNKVLRVNQKYGETVCTECHSLIIRSNDELVSIKPTEIHDNNLAKIDLFPNMKGREIEHLDLSELLSSYDSIEYDEKSLIGDKRTWFRKKTWNGNYSKSVNYSLPVKFDISPDFIKLLAMYIAEGYISSCNGHQAVMVCCGNDIDLINEIEDAFINVFGIDPVFTINRKDNHKDVYGIQTGQRIIVNLFKALCDTGSANKKFPSFVLNIADNLQELFLEYLIKGDGFKYQDNQYHSKQYYADKYNCSPEYLDKYFLYTSKSQHLISGLSVLCLMLGIKFTVNHRESVNAYSLRSGTKYYSTKKFTRIREVDNVEYVYDIETENTHMFVDTLGNLLVHNSAMFTELSALGYPSYMLPEYPLYHLWGATFRANPHLEAEKRMIESRKIYCEKFDVPEEYADNPFEYTDPKIMNKLQTSLIKWIDRDFNEKEAII